MSASFSFAGLRLALFPFNPFNLRQKIKLKKFKSEFEIEEIKKDEFKCEGEIWKLKKLWVKKAEIDKSGNEEIWI